MQVPQAEPKRGSRTTKPKVNAGPSGTRSSETHHQAASVIHARISGDGDKDRNICFTAALGTVARIPS